MKKTILILLLTVTTSAISQEVKIIEINDKNEYSDTGKSINVNDDNIDLNNVFYVNGELMKNLNDIKKINPKAIELFDVKKGKFIVDGITYEKKISIKTYEEYKDNFLLTEKEYSQIKKPIKIIARKQG